LLFGHSCCDFPSTLIFDIRSLPLSKKTAKPQFLHFSRIFDLFSRPTNKE